MNRATSLWQALAPDTHALLHSVRQCIRAQPPTTNWTDQQGAEANTLLERFEVAWAQERVELDTFWALKDLTASLDLAATLTCRAALETIHGHLRRITDLTSEELAVNE